MAVVNRQRLMGRTTAVQSTAVSPQQQLVYSPADSAVLKDISKSLTNIIQLLSQQNRQTVRDADQTRKTQERNRRQGIELGLEKSFATVKNVAQAVVAPVKSILDQIIQYFITIFVGRALILLLNWFADEKNRSKIRSIMRFLSDWWPSLVAGYILFGTGFGRIVRKVAGVAIGATARLVVIAARLAKAIATGKGLKGAAAAFSGGGRLGGLKGFALRGGLATAATIGTGLAINKFAGGDEEQAPQLNVPEAPTTPAMGAFGGGFASLKDLFSASTSGISSKINPFTAFFESGGLASLMQGMNGVVSGPKGIDKVPAMLTDGEFVMSRGAVQKFGVGTLESMNAAGGGTNQPKIIRGIPHAAGGGLIGGKKSEESENNILSSEENHNRNKNKFNSKILPEKNYLNFNGNINFPSQNSPIQNKIYPKTNIDTSSISNAINNIPLKSKSSSSSLFSRMIKKSSQSSPQYNFNYNNLDPKYQFELPQKFISSNVKFLPLSFLYDNNISDVSNKKENINNRQILDDRNSNNTDVKNYFQILKLFGGKDKKNSQNSGLGTSSILFKKVVNNIPKLFEGKEKINQDSKGITSESLSNTNTNTNTNINTNLTLPQQTQVIPQQTQTIPQVKFSTTKSSNLYKKNITPTPRPVPKVVSTKPSVSGGGIGELSGSGGKPSLPIFSASTNNELAVSTLGIG